ncbi:MAG: LamG domain-containing protein, partial [Planctomycetota bacterium]
MHKRLICSTSFVVLLASLLGSSASAELVAHWKFDEGSGNIAHDASGNGNDGTFVGNPQWSIGKIGGALEFNGSSDYIQIPFSESLKVINQGDFSIAAWFMPDEIPSEYKSVFQQADDASGGPGRTWLFVHQSNEIRSSLGGAPTGSGIGIEGGTWYHAAVVVTEGGDTDSVQLYVNGEAAGAPREDSMEDSQGGFYIGAHKGLGNIWDGLLDDIRIYSHAISETEMLAAMEGSSGGFPFAYRPDPADGSIYVETWVNISWSPGDSAVSHDVYLGDNFDDVKDGVGDTFRGNQTDTFVVAGFPGFPFPEGLVAGTTYYWRIDEVNEADPNSPWKGDVWSFSIPPKTAYSPDPPDGAEFVDPNATLSWTPGFGAMLHTVYVGTSFDDVNNAAGGVPQGATTYDPSTLEREEVYYWRVDAFDGAVTYTGNIWGFTTPGAVGNPQPANGASEVQMIETLSWTPADNAASHELYFGTDAHAVKNATTASPEYIGPKELGAESYDPGGLAWHSGYAWRVDEVYPTGTVKGLIWTFATADFLLVDDFEAYNDVDPPDPNSNRIFDKWIDGFGTTTNGALVGNDLPPYAETTIVHGGAQSMIYRYDNAGTTSEATLTLVYPRDWTQENVTRLSLWLRGNMANAADRIFIALNGSSVVYHDDPAATQLTGWNEWVIDLTAFAGVNLANVDSITIGIGTKNSPAAG